MGARKTLCSTRCSARLESTARSESPGEVKPLTLARLSRPGPFEEEPSTGSWTAGGGQRPGSQGEGREDGSHWSQSLGQGEKMKPVDKTRGWKTPGKERLMEQKY